MDRDGCMAMARLEMAQTDRKADSREDSRLGGEYLDSRAHSKSNLVPTPRILPLVSKLS